MRIAINCRSILARTCTGVGRYTWQLIDNLKKIDDKNQYLLYAPSKLFSPSRVIPRIGNKNFIIKKDYFKVGPEKTLGKIDLFHSTSPDSLNIQGCKVIVTVHDLVYKAFPQGHTAATIATTDAQLKEIVKKADKIICCSKNTREDLHKYFNLNENRSCVIYQGVDQGIFYRIDSHDAEEGERYLRSKGIESLYILFVGTIEPRKNLVNLLKAFAILKVQKKFTGKLVVAGMTGWMSEGIKGIIEELKIQDSVIFLGFVSDGELRILYNKAQVFVFPSFYEGFGFPIIEAMSCGAPVVTSNTSSCGEVASDAALKVAPQSPEAIADAIFKLHDNGILRNTYIEKGLKRSQEFSFLKTAQETFKVYQEVSQG